MQMQATRQIRQIVGENIRQRRGEMGMSRRQLAKLIDADPNQIYKWERGLHRPGDNYLTLIAAALERDLGWLLTDHADAPLAA